MCDFLLVRNCNYLVPFASYLTWNNTVTLKSGLEVTQRSLKVMPFESLDAVSYSPSIVSMAIFLAVCEIFSVKEWCDLETGQGSFKVMENGTI